MSSVRALALATTLTSLTAVSQTIGIPREITFIPEEKIDYFPSPRIVGDAALIQASAKVKSGPNTVIYRIALDGSGVEKKWVPKHGEPDGLITSWRVVGDEKPDMIAQGWDKQTGEVAIMVQSRAPDDLQPEGSLVRVGKVPLDPKSYNGEPLNLRMILSPDETKKLIYFDGIQAQGIKLAMCWVLNASNTLLWNGIYRIPVQAYGAQSFVRITDDGKVIVEAEAITLDESNTVEKKDGTVKAQVDKTYYGKTSRTFYMLHAEEFRSWDGRLAGDAETTCTKVIQSPQGGLSFLASTMDSKKKDAHHTWVKGRMDEAFNPVPEAKGSLESPFNRILDSPAGDFFGICSDNEDITVVRIDHDGTLAWKHRAPFSKEPKLGRFKIISDRVAYYDRWGTASLDNLKNGRAAKLDLNTYITIPTIVTWHKGGRNIAPLYPLDSRYKEVPIVSFEESLCEKGMLVRGYHQKEPSFTFVPIAWD